MIDRHERESRIDVRVHDRDINPVTFRDRLPIADGCASKRIDPDLHTRRADGFQVDHIGKVFHVGSDKVLGVRGRGFEGSLEIDSLNAFVALREQFVRAVLNPVGDVGVGRSSVRRIVFEPAIGGRVVRRSDNDAVCQILPSVPDCIQGWSAK